MNNLLITTIFSLMLMIFSSSSSLHESEAKTIVGTWISVDHNTGEDRSLIKIYKAKNGLYYGKIVKLLFDPGIEGKILCIRCPKDDYRYNQPIIGLVVITRLKANSDLTAAVKGKVLDPESGAIVDCQIELADNGQKLKVRGYWKVPAVGVTQTWKRLN
jgi:uncharacterized protein (DUF2147 family)